MGITLLIGRVVGLSLTAHICKLDCPSESSVLCGHVSQAVLFSLTIFFHESTESGRGLVTGPFPHHCTFLSNDAEVFHHRIVLCNSLGSGICMYGIYPKI